MTQVIRFFHLQGAYVLARALPAGTGDVGAKRRNPGERSPATAQIPQQGIDDQKNNYLY